jgi:hypothetical protein
VRFCAVVVMFYSMAGLGYASYVHNPTGIMWFMLALICSLSVVVLYPSKRGKK